MSDDEGSLIGIVVVNVRDDLNGDVSFTSSRGPDDHREAVLHAGANGFHLGDGKKNVTELLLSVIYC